MSSKHSINSVVEDNSMLFMENTCSTRGLHCLRHVASSTKMLSLQNKLGLLYRNVPFFLSNPSFIHQMKNAVVESYTELNILKLNIFNKSKKNKIKGSRFLTASYTVYSFN